MFCIFYGIGESFCFLIAVIQNKHAIGLLCCGFLLVGKILYLLEPKHTFKDFFKHQEDLTDGYLEGENTDIIF